MKQIIIKILEYLGRLWSVFLPMGRRNALKALRDRFYTGYIRGGFRSFGSSVCMWQLYQLVGEGYISVGDDCIIEKDVQLAARKVSDIVPQIKIGNGCLIRKDSHITAVNSITIGNGLLTGTNVIITDNSHGNTEYSNLMQPPRVRDVVSKGRVVIGNNVWLGNNVCVLSGVTIGDGVVVGANSVVTKDIPPYSVAVGVPAEIIKSIESKKEK